MLDLAEETGRSLLETSAFPVFVLGEGGRMLDANGAACAYFGHSREGFRGVDALGVRGYSPARRALFGRRFEAWLSGEAHPFVIAWPPRTGSDRFLVLPQAAAYDGKPSVSLTLLPTPVVEAAMAGRPQESASRARTAAKRSLGTTPPLEGLLASLTPREWEVARRLAEGDRVPMIVEDLGIAENTVRNHLKSIFRKLQVASQAQLVRRLKQRASGRES